MDLERRFHRAQEILRDEMVVEAFEKVKQSIYERWLASRVTVDRETAWHEYKAFLAFKQHFESVMTEGKVKLGLRSSLTPS